ETGVLRMVAGEQLRAETARVERVQDPPIQQVLVILATEPVAIVLRSCSDQQAAAAAKVRLRVESRLAAPVATRGTEQAVHGILLAPSYRRIRGIVVVLVGWLDRTCRRQPLRYVERTAGIRLRERPGINRCHRAAHHTVIAVRCVESSEPAALRYRR